jgi:MFS family permease
VTAAAVEANPVPAAASGWAAAGAVVVFGLVALDLGAVAAALPSVRVDLGSSTSGLVWVQAGYLLALAAGLVLLEALGGAVDWRLPAVAGVALLAGGAALASTADSTATLVTGRFLQGAGTAGLLAPALASLLAGERSRRRIALGAALLLLLALAPLIGGGVAEEAHWRWLFRLEAVAALPALLLVVAGGGGARATAGSSLVGPGARPAALAAGLFCGVTGLIQSGPWGWASADTLLLLLAGAALLAYAWREGLPSREAVAITLGGSLAVPLLLAPQYLDLVRGLSPLRAGLLTLALTLPAAVLAIAVPVLAARLPRRLLPAAGLACAALGALGMTRVDPESSYALVVLSLALLGAGTGAAAAGLARSASRVQRTSLAPGGLAPVTAAGAALVVAASGALLLRAQEGERESGGSFEDALAAGVAASGWLLAALLIVAAASAWRR